MWTRSELKERGKEVFQANYWGTVGTLVLYSLIVGGAAAASSFLIGVGPIAVSLLVVNIIAVGLKRFLMNNRNGEAEVSNLFSAYSQNFGNVLLTMFLRDLFTSLWSLLLIVPGIIKSYEYRMIPFILADEPDIEYKEAFERSKQMMDGEKMNAFLLDLSFLGWFILTGLTCGILAIFWTEPYYEQTCCELYYALKDKADNVVDTVRIEDTSAAGEVSTPDDDADTFAEKADQAASSFDAASDKVVDSVDGVVRDGANSAYEKVSGVMDSISDKASDVAGDIKDHFDKDKE